MKKINFSKYKTPSAYFALFAFICLFIYFTLPYFYDYKKTTRIIEKRFNDNTSLTFKIRGDIKYKLLPSPNLEIKNVYLYKNNLDEEVGEIKKINLKLSITKLLALNKTSFKRLDLYKPTINIKIKEFNYANAEILKKINVHISDGIINFYDTEKYVFSIKKIKLKNLTSQKRIKYFLTGELFDEPFTLKYSKNFKGSNQNHAYEFNLKRKNVRTFISFKKNENLNFVGNSKIYFPKSKLLFNFELDKNKMNIFNSKILSTYFNGNVDGLIEFNPYIFFDLNSNFIKFDLNKAQEIGMNFKKALRLIGVQNFKKINGIIDISINKFKHKNKFFKSSELSLELKNEIILINKMIVELNNFGAFDLIGSIKKEEGSYTNFHFEKNIYIDELKKFKKKFKVNNIDKTTQDYLVSGKLNLNKINIKFFKIFAGNKELNDFESKQISKLFNDIYSGNDLSILFDFTKAKLFVQDIISNY